MLNLPVREKENLFPATVYNKFTDLEIVRVIAEKFSDNEVITNFFDIKGGIKYKKILNPNEKWTGYYGGLIEECKKQRICNTSLTEQESEKVYITGIGDKICDGVADALFIGSSERIRSHFTNMTKEKVEETEQNRAQILTAIPLFVLNNWQQIASPMFTWGCCINTNRYPVQRNW